MTTFQKMLFHSEFSDYSFRSLETMLELQKAGLEEVVLTHVIPSETVGFVPYSGYHKEEAENLKKQAEIHFDEWCAKIQARGLGCKIRIEVGSVTDRIITIAREENVQLIVAGKKKRTLLEVVYVGSHILDLLRRSPVPVLMGKYMVDYESAGETFSRVNDRPFKRPLLATDWSEPSEKALKVICSFKGLSEKVMAAHVIDDRIAKGADAEGLKRLEAESRSRLDRYILQMGKCGIAAESHLAFGRPAQQIIRLSREYQASMIIMGRTGKDWVEEYWLGGVSHKVAEASELPVLLVP